MTKVNNSNFDRLKNSNTERIKKSNFEKVKKNYNSKKIVKTQKLKFEPNSTESLTKLKTQILMQFCDKTQKLQL